MKLNKTVPVLETKQLVLMGLTVSPLAHLVTLANLRSPQHYDVKQITRSLKLAAGLSPFSISRLFLSGGTSHAVFIVIAETQTPNRAILLSNTQLLALCVQYIVSEVFTDVPFPYVFEQQRLTLASSPLWSYI